jgi:predicted aspartyl protease
MSKISEALSPVRRMAALEADLIETRKALKMLYQWVQAEVEHFEAAAPDDEIVQAVEAAIKKAKEVENG